MPLSIQLQNTDKTNNCEAQVNTQQSPLSIGGTFQDPPLWMPETAARIEPYIYIHTDDQV